jgi:NADH-quinone oxidoreductase subunit N
VNLHDLVSQLIVDTKGRPDGAPWEFAPDSSVMAFLPETIICVTIVLMLFVRIFNWGRRVDAFYLALIGSAAALAAGLPWTHLSANPPDASLPFAVTRMEIFTGMLVYDTFTVFMRAVLLLFAVLFCFFTKLSGIPDKDDGPDIYTLVLGATLGMCLMASANHLLMVFLAVEMASVPSYALAGLLKGRRKSSEAALKYSVYGAGAAGVMLYGISLVAGVLNTAHLPTLAMQLGQQLHDNALGGEELMVLALGGLLIMVGLAFKLSAVPFHFWCPDVFEGASAEVNAFLSVASKAAAIALLVRVAVGFGTLPPVGEEPGARTAKLAAKTEATVAGLMSVEDHPVKPANESPSNSSAPLDRAGIVKSLAPARDFMAKLVAFIAVITCTFGNLAAYGQTNIKRLLAYSTIAHAGYLMMAVPPLLAMAGPDPAAAEQAVAALCIYIGIYLFMNLSAFAIVAFLRNAMRSEEIADYAGLLRRSPGIAICFSLVLFSLIGLPPLAGFIGKFAVFAALVDGYRVTRDAGQPANYLLAVLLAGGLNTAISLFYYLRIVKTMTMDPEPEGRPPFSLSSVSLAGAYVWLVTAPTLVLFFAWDLLNQMAMAAARHLLS